MRTHPKFTLDLESVRQALTEMLTAGKIAEAIELVIGLLSRLRDKNTQLEPEVMRLLRRHVGKTSERVSAEQLRLLFETVAAAGQNDQEAAPAAPPDAPLPPPDAKLPEDKPKRKGHGRRPLPAHLPRVVVSHCVPDAERVCPSCGAGRECIGHERSEVLEFIPASFRVEVHEREKLACRVCEEGVVMPPQRRRSSRRDDRGRGCSRMS